MSTAGGVVVAGAGIVTAACRNLAEFREALGSCRRQFHGLTAFAVPAGVGELPVAQVPIELVHPALPRTHQLALLAAREAVGETVPDAIIVGTTTGGIGQTEDALKRNDRSPYEYRFHALDTVAAGLAAEFGVRGPVLTISTACSSSAVALALGHALICKGLARRVLVGGADGLCRLTFHGFRLLQLMSPGGTRPLDLNRDGMTIGEGAAFLLLARAGDVAGPMAELRGAGLSCDAFHATKPHPQGRGALLAMQRALQMSGLAPKDVGYVNLHGTGTADNDSSEITALRALFGDSLPAVSSTKGLTGHTLAAAGAVEAVASVIAIQQGLIPPNLGFETPDPALGVVPVTTPEHRELYAVLSNSFGFAGNNASLLFSRCRPDAQKFVPAALPAFRVLSACCLTSKGGTIATWQAFQAGEQLSGTVPDEAFASALPANVTRRLKRLARMVLALADSANKASGLSSPPGIVCAGTAWGPLAETSDFLRKLYESGELLSSPTDFVGSVHNAPAGQVALWLGAQGANVTCSGGNRSFEQALLSASLLADRSGATALILSAEAWDDTLSALLDPHWAARGKCDGGAALVVVAGDGEVGTRIRYLPEQGGGATATLDDIVACLGGWTQVAAAYGAVMLGIPAADTVAYGQAENVRAQLDGAVPIIDYRDTLGGHADVSGIAAVMAVRMVESGAVPGPGPTQARLRTPSVLLLSLGASVTAMQVVA